MPLIPKFPNPWLATFPTEGAEPGAFTSRARGQESSNRANRGLAPGGRSRRGLPVAPSGPASAARSVAESRELGLSLAIREATEDISFNRYQDFIDDVLCPERTPAT